MREQVPLTNPAEEDSLGLILPDSQPRNRRWLRVPHGSSTDNTGKGNWLELYSQKTGDAPSIAVGPESVPPTLNKREYYWAGWQFLPEESCITIRKCLHPQKIETLLHLLSPGGQASLTRKILTANVSDLNALSHLWAWESLSLRHQDPLPGENAFSVSCRRCRNTSSYSCNRYTKQTKITI